MRNLKKVLALAVAFAMALSMMAFASDFSDQDSITNQDAVDMIATLGIINGYTDGSYQPEKIVTRAEMAKMIYVLKNGGVDDSAAYYTGLSTGLSDIKGHWAEGYIAYCYTLGIIAGKGNGKFEPDAPVTGLEASKMLLVVVGYNADKAGLVGSSWATRTAALASDAKMLSGFKPLLDAGCPRDYAALLIYNALDVNTVKWSDDAGEYVDNDDTVGKKNLDLKVYQGILTAVGDYELDGFSAGDDKVTISAEKIGNTKYAADDWETETFDYEGDASDLLGQYVKITTNGNSTKDDEVIYGIHAVAEENTVVVSTVAKADGTPYTKASDNDGKIKVSGTIYKYDDDAIIYNGMDIVLEDPDEDDSDPESFGTYFNGYQNPSKVTFIDNTGDGKFDLALIVPIKEVKKVTYVTSSSFTAGRSYDFEDVQVYDDIEKGDYVVKTEDYVTGDDVFAKADVVEDKVTGLQYDDYYAGADDNDVSKVEVDGTWYGLACSEDHSSNMYAGDVPTNDSTFELVVFGGFAFDGEKQSAGSTEIALITGAAETKNLDDATDVKLMLGDGTTKTVSAKIINEFDEDDSADGYVTAGSATATYVNSLVTYSVSDGIYELDVIGDEFVNIGDGERSEPNTAGYDNWDADDELDNIAWDEGAGKLITHTVSDSAVIFVASWKSSSNEDTKYSVISGESLNDIGSDFGSAAVVLYDNGGMRDVEVAFINYSGDEGGKLPATGEDTIPAYVLSSRTTTKIDGTTYNKYTVWTTEGSMTVYSETTLSRDRLYSMDVDSEGFVDDPEEDGGAFAVTAYSESRELITLDGTTYDLSDDVEFLYVDSDARSGIEGGEPVTSSSYDEDDDGNDMYYRNARVVFEDNETVLYVVFDVANEYFRGTGDDPYVEED